MVERKNPHSGIFFWLSAEFSCRPRNRQILYVTYFTTSSCFHTRGSVRKLCAGQPAKRIKDTIQFLIGRKRLPAPGSFRVSEAERPVQPVSRFLILFARSIGTWLDCPCRSSFGMCRNSSRNAERTILSIGKRALFRSVGILQSILMKFAEPHVK